MLWRRYPPTQTKDMSDILLRSPLLIVEWEKKPQRAVCIKANDDDEFCFVIRKLSVSEDRSFWKSENKVARKNIKFCKKGKSCEKLVCALMRANK